MPWPSRRSIARSTWPNPGTDRAAPATSLFSPGRWLAWLVPGAPTLISIGQSTACRWMLRARSSRPVARRRAARGHGSASSRPTARTSKGIRRRRIRPKALRFGQETVGAGALTAHDRLRTDTCHRPFSNSPSPQRKRTSVPSGKVPRLRRGAADTTSRDGGCSFSIFASTPRLKWVGKKAVSSITNFSISSTGVV